MSMIRPTKAACAVRKKGDVFALPHSVSSDRSIGGMPLTRAQLDAPRKVEEDCAAGGAAIGPLAMTGRPMPRGEHPGLAIGY